VTGPANDAITLTGFSGTVLTAFLGAIGALRLLTATTEDDESAPLLGWTATYPYTAELLPGRAMTQEDLVKRLHCGMEKLCHGLDLFDQYNIIGRIPPATFSDRLETAAETATPEDRENIDWLAALGSETIYAEDKKKNTGPWLRPPRIVLFNNENDGTAFLANGRELLQNTTETELSDSLFSNWDYDDFRKGEGAPPRLGWDAAEMPNSIGMGQIAKLVKAKPLERGANALAVVGFSLLTALPPRGNRERGPDSLLVSRHGRKESVSWPLWAEPLGLDALRSLISLAELHEEAPPDCLRKIGIMQVMRAEIESGKSRRLGEPQLIW
jgi:hypothetical protein